jgi:uncharacterized phage infection (PIP) family protein YhgE
MNTTLPDGGRMNAILEDYQKYYVLAQMMPNNTDIQSAFQQVDNAQRQLIQNLASVHSQLEGKNKQLQDTLREQQGKLSTGTEDTYELPIWFIKRPWQDSKTASKHRLENDQTLKARQLRINWERFACWVILVATASWGTSTVP